MSEIRVNTLKTVDGSVTVPVSSLSNLGTTVLTTNTAIGGHRIVAMVSGFPQYADCTQVSHASHILGITLEAAASGAQVTIKRGGAVTEPTWAWDPALPVYLGNNGMLTQTLPVGALFSLVIGFPMNPTTLFVAPREPIVLT